MIVNNISKNNTRLVKYLYTLENQLFWIMRSELEIEFYF